MKIIRLILLIMMYAALPFIYLINLANGPVMPKERTR